MENLMAAPPEDGSDNESFKSDLADTRYLQLDSDEYSTSNYASFGSPDVSKDVSDAEDEQEKADIEKEPEDQHKDQMKEEFPKIFDGPEFMILREDPEEEPNIESSKLSRIFVEKLKSYIYILSQ